MKSYIFIFIASSLLLTACGSSSSNNQSQETRMATNTIEAVNEGPQRMQTSEVKENFEYKGKQYQSHIVRRADESLPMVTNDEQQQFYDNSISLKLTCGGKQLVSRTFTKKDFLHLVDANFAKQAILEGIVFNEANEQGICFAASVGHPESDLYQPIRIVVSANGNLSISLEEDMMEVTSAEEGENS